jgi:hypothetical protein
MTDEDPTYRQSVTMYDPSLEQRRLVRVMSGFGIPQTDIATQIGIDPKTLRKHFREELDRGTTEAKLKVAQSLFNMAAVGNNVAAAIFRMNARGGWREKPLPDEEATRNAEPTRMVISWVSPKDVHRLEPYPGGQKPVTEDAEPD